MGIEPSPLILYVEDDEDTRIVVHRWLRDLGAVTVGVGSAVAALELCRATMPRIVITDLHMPYMDGEAFIRTLAREFGALAPPVLVLTGARSRHWRPDLPLVEAVIHKPADRREVVEEVRRCLSLSGLRAGAAS